MKKKAIRLTSEDTYDANWQDGIEEDERFEAAVGQLLDADAGYDEDDPLTTASPVSRNGSNGVRKTKQEEIESLLERMVLSERAFLEYPN
ncbi:MAG: hypothetical protein WD733_15910 [Bryobacterales bacterium]